FRRSNHIIRITTVEMQRGHLAINTRKEIASKTVYAMAASPTEPADTNSLSGFPPIDTGADGINDAGDFMTRNTRIGYAWHKVLFNDCIAVTDSTGLNFDSDCSRVWFRNVAFDNLEWGIWFGHLNGSHLWHGSSNRLRVAV